MANNRGKLANTKHYSTHKALSWLRKLLPSARNKPCKADQSHLSSSTRTSSGSLRRESTSAFPGDINRFHTGGASGQDKSEDSSTSLIELGSRKQKLLPDTHEELLTSGPCRSETLPIVSRDSDRLAMSCKMTPLHHPSNTFRSPKVAKAPSEFVPQYPTLLLVPTPPTPSISPYGRVGNLQGKPFPRPVSAGGSVNRNMPCSPPHVTTTRDHSYSLSDDVTLPSRGTGGPTRPRTAWSSQENTFPSDGRFGPPTAPPSIPLPALPPGALAKRARQ